MNFITSLWMVPLLLLLMQKLILDLIVVSGASPTVWTWDPFSLRELGGVGAQDYATGAFSPQLVTVKYTTFTAHKQEAGTRDSTTTMCVVLVEVFVTRTKMLIGKVLFLSIWLLEYVYWCTPNGCSSKRGEQAYFSYIFIKNGLFLRVGLFLKIAVLKGMATLLAFGLALTDSILIPVTNTCTGDS